MSNFIEDEFDKLGLSSQQYPCDKYFTYIEILHEWNQAYNLTAVKEPNEILSRHIIDSLLVLPYIEGKKCLDIGTGAGIPGLILALAQPEKKWVLLDSSQKKVRFLKHLKYKLHIENIEIVRSQVIEYKPTLPFDTLICRAFAPLDRMIIETEHLINNSNQLLAMKGESIDREIKLLQSHNFQTQIIDLSHPDLASQPKLVRIKSLN